VLLRLQLSDICLISLLLFDITLMMVGINTIEHSLQYNAKDVIQYALSIGIGSDIHTYNEQLQYIYEDHPQFSVVPTFALTFLFHAKDDWDESNISALPPFPPPLMKSMGVLPKNVLKKDVNIDEYPILHTAQSIEWINDLPVPDKTNVVVFIEGKFVSVIPKSIGAFVATEFTVYEKRKGAANTTIRIQLCIIRSTALILGIPSEVIHRYDSLNENLTDRYCKYFLHDKKKPLLELDYHIASNTALLYRLASGDSNKIHVDPKAVPVMVSSERGSNEEENLPILHGFCTLAIVGRIILQHLCLRYDDNIAIRFLECRFVNPIFINDIVTIRASEMLNNSHGDTLSISFIVIKKSSELVAVDSGRMHLVRKNNTLSHLRSNL
jgi:acyl dehydratase